MATPNEIILGEGVFAIGGTAIGLTRGGGKFTLEREFRQVEADGDYGPVKGRIRKIRSVAKLTMNALELLPANLPKLYPAIKNTTAAGPPITDTITGLVDIVTGDYNATVTWTGRTVGGRSVVITVENAINLEGIEWPLVDKDEVLQEITYTATYTEAARTTEPWKIVYTDAV